MIIQQKSALLVLLLALTAIVAPTNAQMLDEQNDQPTDEEPKPQPRDEEPKPRQMVTECPVSTICSDVLAPVTEYRMIRFTTDRHYEIKCVSESEVRGYGMEGWKCHLKRRGLKRVATGQLEIPDSLERAREIVKHIGGDFDASFHTMENVLSADQCVNAINTIDRVSLEHKVKTHDTGDYSNYHVEFVAEQLVQMVGKDGLEKMYEFFKSTFPTKAVTQIVGRRMDYQGDTFVPYHNDGDEGVSSMIVTLNYDFEGGDLVYLNKDGVHFASPSSGTALAHTDGAVHAAAGVYGVRYSLFLISGSENPNNCMLRSIM